MQFYVFFMIIFSMIFTQHVKNLEQFKAPKEFDNIHVIPIESDQHVSSYIIFVKKSIKAHKHIKHTESILVLEGTGKMKIDNNVYEIKHGDYLTIPQGAIHSVIVTSKVPLKVLSLQTPQFFGKDRIFVE